jgi:hypothetical protein
MVLTKAAFFPLCEKGEVASGGILCPPRPPQTLTTLPPPSLRDNPIPAKKIKLF